MNRFTQEQLRGRLRSYRGRHTDLPPPFRWAAVAIILRPRGRRDADILFIKRAQHPDDPWSGHMAFPGGRKDDADPSILATVIRECQEELNLDLSTYPPLTQLSDLQASSRKGFHAMVIRPFVFLLDRDPALNPNEEVDEVVWLPLSMLLSGAAHGVRSLERHGHVFDFPCIRHGDYVIWGLTYQMLHELLECLKESRKE